MIPGLLHGRRLSAPPAGGVIAAPAYQDLLAYDNGSSSAAATARFNVNPDGTWTSSGNSYPDKSGSWYSPITADAGDDYEVRITLTKTGGVTGIVTNEASGWVALSQARTATVKSQRFTGGSTIAYYTAKVEIRPAGGGAVVSTGTFPITVTAQVQSSSGGGGGGGCPALEMWVGHGLTAGDVAIGQKIDGVTEDAPETIVRLPVLADQVSRQPCYRIMTASGAACILSDSTPFTLRDGSTRYAGQMLGEQVLRETDDGGLVWEEVVACYPVGERDVVKISVGGHSLLAGENPRMRIVSHNQEKQ